MLSVWTSVSAGTAAHFTGKLTSDFTRDPAERDCAAGGFARQQHQHNSRGCSYQPLLYAATSKQADRGIEVQSLLAAQHRGRGTGRGRARHHRQTGAFAPTLRCFADRDTASGRTTSSCTEHPHRNVHAHREQTAGPSLTIADIHQSTRGTPSRCLDCWPSHSPSHLSSFLHQLHQYMAS